MKLKRTIGTGKIFWYSCGAVIALAGVVWLIINGVFAVYISSEEPEWRWFDGYAKAAADIITPWLLMAASMAIGYRYMKMCSANNVSCTKQTGVFSLLSVFVSMAFAAADLLTAKLVMKPLYGGIIITQFEEDKSGYSYFSYIIRKYVWSFEEDIPQTISPYTMNTLLLLFALMTVYYYCFFIAGYYIVWCFRYGGKKIRIYYVVMTVLGIIAFVAGPDLSAKDTDLTIILTLILIAIIIVNALTNPVVFLYVLPILILGNIEEIIVGFIIMTVFVLITILGITILGSEQFPKKRKIKKVLKNYNAQNNCGEGGTSQ